jgi:N-6 DNA Methylase
MNKNLGQYMTPVRIANLVAQELGNCETVVDFAAGEGALLKAVSELWGSKLLGFDIDKSMVTKATQALVGSDIRRGDGLRSRLPQSRLGGTLGVIGNPPFKGDCPDKHKWLQRAFVGICGKLGQDRSELQFLARSLITARLRGGKVAIVLPISFADGDVYRQLRTLLMTQYKVLRCIEMSGDVFNNTEARTVILVVDTKEMSSGAIEIAEVDPSSNVVHSVCTKILTPGSRLDARFHKAMARMTTQAGPQLQDLKVTIVRGIVSRKEAEFMNISALHTSDLGRAKEGRLAVSRTTPGGDSRHVVARSGDILLPRTGSRVRWEPVLIESGASPITDHVFRIRAPAAVRKIVLESFKHPAFKDWIHGVSKGVCATVLTKRELMQMPAFAANA